MDDLISIIIPVYKVEEYLNRCLDSIISQTHTNLEIILVDDGSPDRCGLICDNYAKLDDRIKVIHKGNGGLSDARNAGIEIASGEYLSFLDSDDWVHGEYIERLYQLSKSTDSDISVCNFLRTSVEEVNIEGLNIEIHEFNNIEALEQLSGRFYVPLIVAWGKLYKKKLFKEIRYPLGKIHEDEFTTYKLLYKSNKITLTTEQLLYYWQRPDSIMGTGFKLKNKLHAIEALQERAEFFNNIGRSDFEDQTFKSLFGMYKIVNENIHMFEDEDSKVKYIVDYSRFKTKLRNSKQSTKFKLYYETYFISPRLAGAMERINSKIRGLQNLSKNT